MTKRSGSMNFGSDIVKHAGEKAAYTLILLGSVIIVISVAVSWLILGLTRQ